MNIVGFRVSTSLAICWIALFASAILATPVVAAQSRGETQGAYSRSNDTAVARSRQRNPGPHQHGHHKSSAPKPAPAPRIDSTPPTFTLDIAGELERETPLTLSAPTSFPMKIYHTGAPVAGVTLGVSAFVDDRGQTVPVRLKTEGAPGDGTQQLEIGDATRPIIPVDLVVPSLPPGGAKGQVILAPKGASIAPVKWALALKPPTLDPPANAQSHENSSPVFTLDIADQDGKEVPITVSGCSNVPLKIYLSGGEVSAAALELSQFVDAQGAKVDVRLRFHENSEAGDTHTRARPRMMTHTLRLARMSLKGALSLSSWSFGSFPR